MTLTKEQRKMLETDLKRLHRESRFTLQYGIGLIMVGLLVMLTGIPLLGTIALVLFIFGSLSVFDVQRINREKRKTEFQLAGK